MKKNKWNKILKDGLPDNTRWVRVAYLHKWHDVLVEGHNWLNTYGVWMVEFEHRSIVYWQEIDLPEHKF